MGYCSANPVGPQMNVAVFRPADDRMRNAIELIESLGATPIPDPMLEIRPTGKVPRTDGEYLIITSKTGAEIIGDANWTADGMTICAVGQPTADALRSVGYEVDIIPDEYTSTGIVEELRNFVDGHRVEIARSNHGSDILIDGLIDSGAYVHETVLYRIEIPQGAGASVELAAQGELDVVLFTSSLTVQHFLEIADSRDLRAEVNDGIGDALVAAIGEPTRRTAESLGIDIDLVPATATFDALACEAIEAAAPTYHE